MVKYQIMDQPDKASLNNVATLHNLSRKGTLFWQAACLLVLYTCAIYTGQKISTHMVSILCMTYTRKARL